MAAIRRRGAQRLLNNNNTTTDDTNTSDNNNHNNNRGVVNHHSGLGQMMNPLNTCFAASTVQLVVAAGLDEHLDPTVALGAGERLLAQVTILVDDHMITLCRWCGLCVQ